LNGVCVKMREIVRIRSFGRWNQS